jgi:flagellar biosynthesis/type III secretory pathway chaperone
MNDLTVQIKKQIGNCSRLLEVFQNERQLYRNKQQVGITEVMQILERKKTIVEIFDKQHVIVKELRENSAGAPPAIQAEHKEMMRELSSILEQLLVIDHENEKLLRENISSRKVTEAPSRPAVQKSSCRERLALQRQLPFVPGVRLASPATETAASRMTVPQNSAPVMAASIRKATVESSVDAVREDERPRARHLIKNYAKARFLNLTSKYA